MNKETFNELIKAPANVDPKHKKDLRTLVDTFPYSASIRLLYLSSLLNDCDILFDEELKKAAAYITDRRILKKLTQKPDSQNNYIIKEAPLETVKKEQKITIDDPIEVAEIKLKEIQNKKSKKINNSLDVCESNSEGDTTDKSPLNFKIGESSNSITKDVSEETSNKKIPELNQLIITSAVNASLSIEIDKASSEIKANKEAEAKIKKIASQSPKSFLEWIGGATVDEVKPTLNQKDQERVEFREKAEALIDQFIENQPRVKPKTEFYSPENMAQKSIEYSGGIVTETLAKVYATQGNIVKAKSIYEQLILNNPEKKSYFASLLKKLGKD